MDVEHRCGVRNSIEIEATLNSPSRGGVPCRVRNLGAGGMFVQFAGRPLHPCAIVEVLLKVPLAGRGRRVFLIHRWPAMVVHGLAGGAGLMFDRPRRQEVAAIIAALLKRVGDGPAVSPGRGTAARPPASVRTTSISAA
jgi:hypothetical protein